MLSEVQVETCVEEPTLGDLLRHQLRWLRTVRTVQPLGYVFGAVTFGLPVALAGTVLAGGSFTALALLAITAAARLMVNSAPRSAYSLPGQLALVAVSDLSGFALWCWSFATRRVHWRDGSYQLARDGTIHPIPH